MPGTQTTSSLSEEVYAYYYVDQFLARAKKQLRHDQGGQKRTQSQGVGTHLRFTRMAPMADATTALTEGTNPAFVDLDDSNVDVALAEYGNAVKISKLLSLTSIDRRAAEKISVLGQNMGQTIDTITRTALIAGATVQLAAGRANLDAITTSDKLTVSEIARAVRDLKVADAMPYDDGYFLLKANPYTTYDIMSDTAWVNSHTYKDGEAWYEGEVGKILQARVIETTNQYSEENAAGTPVTVFSNLIHGENAFGTFNLDGDMPKLYIKTPGPQSTDNVADRFNTIAWAGTFAAKVLNAAWIRNIKTAASDQ